MVSTVYQDFVALTLTSFEIVLDETDALAEINMTASSYLYCLHMFTSITLCPIQALHNSQKSGTDFHGKFLYPKPYMTCTYLCSELILL